MLVLGLALAAATPVDIANRDDAQCFYVLSWQAVEEKDNPDELNNIRRTMAFFMGRIEGRSPGIDFKKLILSTPLPTRGEPSTLRCLALATSMSDAIDGIRAGMSARAN